MGPFWSAPPGAALWMVARNSLIPVMPFLAALFSIRESKAGSRPPPAVLPPLQNLFFSNLLSPFSALTRPIAPTAFLLYSSNSRA
ncbi:MAG: hypothetical protein PHX83_15110 [Acidobacteriia bacterium]|nr:hypothetical protein [Terriglobia bacterium]